jgi:hypothetical protein
MLTSCKASFTALGGLLLFLEGGGLMHENVLGACTCISLYLIVDLDRVHAWDVYVLARQDATRLDPFPESSHYTLLGCQYDR